MKDKLKKILLKAKYIFKIKKLDMNNSFLDFIIERDNLKDFQVILELIHESKNKQDFSNNIQDSSKNNGYYKCSLLLGSFLGFYDSSFFNCKHIDIKPEYFSNFSNSNFEKVYEILKNYFFEYVINNNSYKNSFLSTDILSYDFTKDINKETVDAFFESVIKNHEVNDKSYSDDRNIILYNYLISILSKYSIDDIINNFNFIKKDLNNKSDKSLEERKEEFEKNIDLSDIEKEHLKNVDVLEKRLKSISSESSKTLLDRLNKIKDNLSNNIEELNDIYLDYELLFREDIVDKLYIPNSEITVVDNYNDLRPQLIHQFIRNPEKFKEDLVEKIKEDILSKRKNKSDNNDLTPEEQLEFDKRIKLVETELDQTKVNYSFDPIGFYSDSSGFRSYKSNTSNQIAASIYSEEYFLKNFNRVGMIGIGFNKEGLTPEAIALSSSSYLTTNMGLNNIEYNENIEFRVMSTPYEELKENDGNSEVVMFRRNIDYDTKASYVFCTIDSSKEEKSREIFKRCKKLAESSNLKLVVYDLYRIRKSYENSINKQEQIVVESPKTR